MSIYLLGIDIGTSACKVALFTPNGEIAAQGSAEYPVYYPKPGWAEQNPDEWWDAVCTAIKQMLTQNNIDSRDISGIGVDGQSWSAIPVSQSGKVLYNTPIWFDTRAAEICNILKQTISEDEIFRLCGNPLQPSYSLPKILWLKQNYPDVYENACCFLQSNSFIVYRLTDVFTQDKSQGYGLHCYDMRRGQWDKDMCEKIGIDFRKLPKLFSCHQLVGTVTKRAAEQTGLTVGTPVVAGGLDAACGALGVGVLQPGETQEQGGQAGGMSICMDSYHADNRLILSSHVVPDRWILQGGTVGGGGVVRWFEQEFGSEERTLAAENNTNSFYEMDQKAAAIPPGSDGVVFLPYMAGERSPIWNEHAKGVYYGLDYAKTRAHMMRASMEGVAFSLQHNLEIAEQAGVKVEILRSMGGAANSRVWTQMKADITGKPIIVPSSDTATTLGAAILAGVGVGIYQSFEEAVAGTVTIKREYHPNPEHYAAYQKAYQVYLKLYEYLKPIMKEKN